MKRLRPFFAYRQEKLFIMRQGRGSEATEPFFAFRARKPLHTGVGTGCHYLICLSVCLSMCVCVTFVVFTDYESRTGPISTNPGSMEAGEYGLMRGTYFVTPSRGGRDRRPTVDFVVCFGWGGFFRVLFSFFILRTHTACCKYDAPLPHLPP